MFVTTLGSGDPEVAVVGAVHGDEPCGPRAIERFLKEERPILNPVKFVIANERALARGVRYIETDMNRQIPGKPDSDIYEERLAHQLVVETDGCMSLGIHSTVSYEEPFGAAAEIDGRKRRALKSLGVDKVFDVSAISGNRCVDLPNFVDVEAGLQGSAKAVENAYGCMLNFLREYNVIDGEAISTNPELYKVFHVENKKPECEYHVVARNFEKVEAGDVYALEDTSELRAKHEFWPVLMSANGHENILGYHGKFVGKL